MINIKKNIYFILVILVITISSTKVHGVVEYTSKFYDNNMVEMITKKITEDNKHTTIEQINFDTKGKHSSTIIKKLTSKKMTSMVTDYYHYKDKSYYLSSTSKKIYKEGVLTKNIIISYNNIGKLNYISKTNKALKTEINYYDYKMISKKVTQYNKDGKIDKYHYYFLKNNSLEQSDEFILVNKDYPLSSNDNNGVDKMTKLAFKKMSMEAKSQGINLNVLSWYRSYQEQVQTKKYWQSKDGNYADKYSANPGESEHQTGMAIDIGSSTNPNTNLTTAFENTIEGIWLKMNAHKFGFIIRYPKDKTSKTGYVYEPWHIRYIGGELDHASYHASMVVETNLSIEEYFGVVK